MNEINSEARPDCIEMETSQTEYEPVIEPPEVGPTTESEDEFYSEKPEVSESASIPNEEENINAGCTDNLEETEPPIADKIIEGDVEQIEKEIRNEAESALNAEQLRIALAESINTLLTEIGKVNSSIADVNARVSTLRKLADMHEEIENNLNTQINEYKDNLYRRIVNPILVEFFDIQEDMNLDALSADYDTKKLLLDYVQAISKVFKHYGVEVENVSEGDTYNPRIHKPVKTVPTDNIGLDKTIARTRKTLVHSIDGKVIERAYVNVYQYREPVSEPLSEGTEKSDS